MTHHILDMDGTLCYPSPYAAPGFLAMPLEDQKRRTHDDDFLQAILDAPVASWVLADGSPLVFNGGAFVVITGRHEHVLDHTAEWLREKLEIKADAIISVAFNDANTYVAEKVAAIKTAVALLMTYGLKNEKIEIYEDDERVCAKVEFYFQENPRVTVYQVRCGHIIIDDIPEERAHEDDYERWGTRHR
jgi:hypothetical protein